MSLIFGQIRPRTVELSALEPLKNLMFNVVNTLEPLFLIESSSYFQVTRTTMKSRINWNLGQICKLTAELAAIERLKKSHRITMGEML